MKIPLSERPRERFLKHGPAALSLLELLALILGSGTKGKSVLSLAEELLAHFGTLQNLKRASVNDLLQIKGIGSAKAIQLRAVFELSSKESQLPGRAKYPLFSHKDAYILIEQLFEQQSKEMLAILLRNVKGDVFHHEVLCIGTLTSMIVHPREVFSVAIKKSAYSIIIAHNHPSGDATPSNADLKLTKILQDTGDLLGIPLDDHLIIGSQDYTSLWEKGLMPRARY